MQWFNVSLATWARPISFIFLILLPFRFASSSELANDLSVATWNFENLNGVHGRALFEGRSYERTQRDFDAFRKYVLEASADVVLLQEVASPKAMRQVLPAKYNYLISSQYFDILPAVGIYTGIAYDPSTVKVIATVAIPTGIRHIEGSGRAAGARDTVGIQVLWGAARVWILSVHLKSSCNRKSLPHETNPTDCRILYQQLLILRQWITRLRADGSSVIIGGDFNRRGDPNYTDDSYLSVLDTAGDVKQIVRTDRRECSTFSGKDRNPIDYFVLFGLADALVQAKEISIHEQDIKVGYKLSDHCPVRLQLSRKFAAQVPNSRKVPY